MGNLIVRKQINNKLEAALNAQMAWCCFFSLFKVLLKFIFETTPNK